MDKAVERLRDLCRRAHSLLWDAALCEDGIDGQDALDLMREIEREIPELAAERETDDE